MTTTTTTTPGGSTVTLTARDGHQLGAYVARPAGRPRGAVVLLHNCPAGCSDVTTAFSNLVKGFKGDTVCKPARFVITPDAALANKVAAVAWGWTFTADCLDARSDCRP